MRSERGKVRGDCRKMRGDRSEVRGNGGEVRGRREACGEIIAPRLQRPSASGRRSAQ